MEPEVTDYAGRANRYAERVVAGEIVSCAHARQACQRQLRDLERSDIAWSPDAANRICWFVEGLQHVKGELARKREHIQLEDWQCFNLAVPFGWVSAETGLRRYKTAYTEVPRKNAKTTIAAAVALYLLAADREEGAEIYCAATTRDQARIAFSIARQMANRDAGLRDAFGVEVNAHNLNVQDTFSKLEPLSAEANSLDGLNVHGGVIDELHAHKTREVFDVIETGTGSRMQPMLWLITTAGSNRAGICYEQRSYLRKILGGQVQDDSYFGIIYTIDDGDDWQDSGVWRKANPNYGISVMPEDIARLAKKASHTTSARNPFLTKRLNVWVNADVAWMDMFKWDACADPDLVIEDFEGCEGWWAFDLASKIDIAARMALFERDGHYYAFGRYYLPESAVEDSGNAQYAGWVEDGRIVTTPGNVLDYGQIEDDLVDDAKRFTILEAGFDPFQATQFSSRMIDEGLPMVEIGATVKNFSEPMKELEALVLAGRFHHDGCKVLSWMVGNVVCHVDAKDNIYPRKEDRAEKIDGVVSLIMTINRAIAARDDAMEIPEGYEMVMV